VRWDPIKKLLKDIRGSPLVEEGILLSLTIVSLAVVLSLIVGIFSGVEKALGGANQAVNNFLVSALDSLNSLVKQLNNFVSP